MEIISNREEFHIDGRTAVAIGKFDGMHLGHQYLIYELVRIARTNADGALKTVVFTFDPSPAAFFSGKPVKELFTREEKREVFAALGVDVLIEFPMNASTAAIPAEVFVERVLNGFLHASCVIAGTDLSFGHLGKGDFGLLKKLAETYGFRTQQIDKVSYDGSVISSSRIREAVREGQIELANTLLGTNYALSGTVLHGRHLGHTLGFPTLNLAVPENKLMPPYGVYLSRVFTSRAEDPVPAITNIGVKPTVGGENAPLAETYLYGTDGDFYGEHIRLELLSFRRKEKKFASVEALKEQLRRDIDVGRHLHGLGSNDGMYVPPGDGVLYSPFET